MFSALGDLVMGHRHLHMWLQGLRASCFTSECLHALPSSGTTDRGMSSVYWAVSAVRTLTTKAASITVSALHYDKHSKVNKAMRRAHRPQGASQRACYACRSCKLHSVMAAVPGFQLNC
jgi:hypothetical protein